MASSRKPGRESSTPEVAQGWPVDSTPQSSAVSSPQFSLETIDLETDAGPAARWKYFALTAIILYAAVRNFVQATVKPLWFDEILTEILAREPSASALWRALKTAVDGQPPLFYLVEKFAGGLAGNEHIAYRVPSILAFSCTFICLYLFVSRGSGPRIGLICAGAVMLTQVYTLYADEARPYGMLVACVAFALVCYQRLPRVGWTVGLFLSLLLATCLHYYGVLALSPFLAAEFFLAVRMRQVRPLVWCALLATAAPLVIERPLMVAIRSTYVHFWAPAALLGALRTYGDLIGVATPWGFALLGICMIAAGMALWRTASSDAEPAERSSSHEHVLVLTLLAYPFIVFTVAKVTHGGYTPRYAICGILGLAIALRYILEYFRPRGAVVAAAFLLLAFGAQEFTFWRTVRQDRGAAMLPADETSKLVESAGMEGVPVVITDPGRYLEIWHYAPPELKSRICAVVDPASAYLISGIDVNEKLMLALSQLAPVDVYMFSDFAAAHRSFLLFTNGSSFDSLTRLLIRRHDTLRLLAIGAYGALYRVDLGNAGN